MLPPEIINIIMNYAPRCILCKKYTFEYEHPSPLFNPNAICCNKCLYKKGGIKKVIEYFKLMESLKTVPTASLESSTRVWKTKSLKFWRNGWSW